LDYDPLTDKWLLFQQIGATNPWTQKVYSMSPTSPSSGWTLKTATGAPSNVLSSGHPKQVWARATSGAWSGKFFYRRTSDGAGSGQGADYIYDSVADTFTAISSTGTGPEGLVFMAFAPNVGSHGALIAYETNVGWWKGLLQ
jgi:hypothetical protein